MPANLTADYLAAEQLYKRAQTHDERIAALEQMIAALPKHKGTEKMHADLRRRLSQERKDSQKKTGARASPAYLIKREGAGQIALVGPPNAGKSQMICALTHARPEVAEYPFTTRMPAPGMMLYENVHIQLVDTPAISPDFTEPWLPQVMRAADATALIVDPQDPDVLGEIESIAASLESWRAPRPELLVCNKLDLDPDRRNFAAIQDLYSGQFRCVGVSALTGVGLAEFARAAFDALKLVRFYSKPPGKPPDLATPYVLRRGATVEDAAGHVHRDFSEHLKFARRYRNDHERDGLMVERSHAVEDEDILEFHI
jgi:ribosome-interacting GTPase 1